MMIFVLRKVEEGNYYLEMFVVILNNGVVLDMSNFELFKELLCGIEEGIQE